MTRDDVFVHCLRNRYGADYAQYWMDHLVCEAGCEKPSQPPHHLRTRGAGGDDSPENLLALCVEDHAIIGTMGRQEFVRRYPHLKRKIEAAFERPRGLLCAG
ncbi:MAG: hypothetical protein NTZ09_04200 [Candidatus Hydrogenedentes bacterium]|nr:hypothetical protein [Candidatus Hydrogenedentota bacterium]